MEQKYITFLKKICKEYWKKREPISLDILKKKLATKFNLSSDYCNTFVDKAYHERKLK